MREGVMPVVTIHMERGRPIEMKGTLSDAVTKAVKVALDVPPEWVTIILDEVEREDWAVGGRLRANPENDAGSECSKRL